MLLKSGMVQYSHYCPYEALSSNNHYFFNFAVVCYNCWFSKLKKGSLLQPVSNSPGIFKDLFCLCTRRFHLVWTLLLKLYYKKAIRANFTEKNISLDARDIKWFSF